MGRSRWWWRSVTGMDARELSMDIFQALYERWVEGVETPERFVGMQGDKIVVMQPGGEHFAVVVIPAMVGASS